MLRAKPSGTASKYGSAPVWLMEVGDQRALQVFMWMTVLGDWRHHTYRYGADLLAQHCHCDPVTIERAWRTLVSVGAIAPTRRPGRTTIFRLCDPAVNHPLTAVVTPADSRNSLRGTRERVEDMDGERLASYFEDCVLTSPWCQVHMAGIPVFGKKQAAIQDIQRTCTADGAGQLELKMLIDVFIDSPEQFVDPEGKARAWTRFTAARDAVTIAAKAILAREEYDDHVGAWPEEIAENWYKFGPPAPPHRWPQKSDDNPYAWYHAHPVSGSKSDTAKPLSTWSNEDLADHIAGVLRSRGIEVKDHTVPEFANYLDKHRTKEVTPDLVLAYFDGRYARVVRNGQMPTDGIVLGIFANRSYYEGQITVSAQYLAFVRYGEDPKLVIGRSPLKRASRGA
jgi:hypothetical protein